MEAIKTIDTQWYPEERLIITQISGDVDKDDVEAWEQSLHEQLARVEDGATFKIFINLYGFKAVDLDAHKRFRAIVPSTLANYGWKVGYVNLFDEAASMVLKNERGIQCVAAVHCHQDSTKIEQYESRFGKDNEHFYTDPVLAEQWIRSVSLS